MLSVFPMLRELRISEKAQRLAIISEIRTIYNTKEIEKLTNIACRLGQNASDFTELPLFMARLNFEHGDFNNALDNAHWALEIDSENFIAQLILMRSAMKLENFVIANCASLKITANEDLATPRAVQEAQLNLNRIPRLSFVAFKNTDDLVEKFQLLKVASASEDLRSIVDKQLHILKKNMMSKLVDKEKQQDEDIISFGMKINDSFPGEERVLHIIGRNLVKRREYKIASPLWQQLCELNPENENYAMQLQRCMQRSQHSKEV
jgi:tetratricopeptide (TPR) repeat protein